MVVFTCNHCGESLQKPKVLKHYQFQCFKPESLTCVDCLNDFRGEEYVKHNKCITENQRYGGKDYVPKANQNKGERKQQEWVNNLQDLIRSSKLSNPEKNFLQALLKYENVPRKKAKFINFVRNNYGNKINMDLVNSVWSKIEACMNSSNENSKNPNQSQEKMNTNETDENIHTNLENGTLKKSDNKESKKKKKEHINGHEMREENSNHLPTEESDQPNLQSHPKHLQEKQNNGNIENEKSGKSEKKKSKKRKIEKLDEQDGNVNQSQDKEVCSMDDHPSSQPHQQHIKKNKNHEHISTSEGIETCEKIEKKKSKKRKSENMNEEETREVVSKQTCKHEDADEEHLEKDESNVNDCEKFNWKHSILSILESKKEMSLKKLQKKVISQYMVHKSVEIPDDKILTKFRKKLEKISSVSIVNEKVILI